MKKISIALFALLAPVACKKVATNSSEKIINGAEVKDDNATALKRGVVLFWDIGAVCTGTLVAEDLVLTAAHCADVIQSPNALVVYSADVHSGAAKGVEIEGTRVNPDYAKNGERVIDDIALVKIFPIPDAHTVIKIGRDVPKADELIFNSGYGRTTNADLDSTGKLTIALSKVVGFDTTKGLTTLALGNTQVCKGDSGGPAFILRDKEYVNYGILSATQVDPETHEICQGGHAYFNLPGNHIPLLKQWAKEMTGRDVEFNGPEAAPTPTPAPAPAPNTPVEKWTDPTSKKQYPYCSASIKATVAGCGWENNASCKIKPSKNALAGVWADPTTGKKFPLCSEGQKDTGGGWGYENEQSCKIRSAKNGYWTDPTTKLKFIYCSKGVKDTGKGWGWENSASCKIK